MPEANEHHDVTTIGGWLKELRRRRGWTQRNAADHLGTVQPHYWRWETERETPMDFYQHILTLLGIESRMPPFPARDPYETRRGPRHANSKETITQPGS